jgi:hypothetical protein
LTLRKSECPRLETRSARFIKADDDATGTKIESDQAGDHSEKRHKENSRQGKHHGQRHLTPVGNWRGGLGRGFDRFGRYIDGHVAPHARTLPDDSNPEYSAAAMKDW